MKITSAYDVKIKEYRHIFDETVRVYRKAVDYLIDVCDDRWDEIAAISGAKLRQRFVETLVHNTRNNIALYDYDHAFPKFPNYLRRAAITCAIGNVSSWKSNLANWEASPSGKQPRKPCAGNTFPVLYRGDCFKPIDGNEYACEIKVYIRNTWDWVTVCLRKSDVDYINRRCANRAEKAPSLVKHGKCWHLSFPFEERAELTESVSLFMLSPLGLSSRKPPLL